ncbi:MAG: hypothetical protein ACK476_09565 [Fluviicola sp.]|jgi:hypothetical protein
MFNKKYIITSEEFNEITDLLDSLELVFKKPNFDNLRLISNYIDENNVVSLFSCICEQIGRKIEFTYIDDFLWKNNSPVLYDFLRDKNNQIFKIEIYNYSRQVIDIALLSFLFEIAKVEIDEKFDEGELKFLENPRALELNQLLFIFYWGFGFLLLSRITINYKFRDTNTNQLFSGFYELPMDIEYLAFLEALIKYRYDKENELEVFHKILIKKSSLLINSFYRNISNKNDITSGITN